MNTPDVSIASQGEALTRLPCGEAHSRDDGALNPPVIFPAKQSPDLMVGMVFRDTRPESLERVHAHIRRLRRDNGERRGSLPKMLHFRVLRVEPEWAKVIAVEDVSTLEQTVRPSEIFGFINTREWVLTDREPLAILRLSDERLSPSQKRCRDRNKELIKPLTDLGAQIFEPSVRGPIIRKICESREVAETKIYRILRRLMQGGMNPNALAGRWFRRTLNIGAGSRVLCKVEVRAGVKPHLVGRPRLDGRRPFLVTEGDVRTIVRGAAKYYHTPDGGNWRRAWLLAIADSYIAIDPDSDLSEEKQLLRFTPEQYPSLAQFRYWAKTDKMIVARLKKRHGQKFFDLNLRPLQGKTELDATGPGDIFQIDPTPYDVVAVHQVSRRPIGKLILYIVVDAFSHMIVGYFVHVGNAGFDPASLALLATAQDKVELCRQFGMEISENEWPAACFPSLLVADSELASLKAHALAEKGVLNVRIVPAFRADLKGLVEALIGAASRKARHLPGHTSGVRKRATMSPDVTAALDYREVNQTIIMWIRQRNRRVLEDYHLTNEMIADGLIPTPLNLWNWGVPNSAGLRRKWDNESIKRSCLPTAVGRITRRGLEYSALSFEPIDKMALPDFDVWRVQAAIREWTVKVSYHPACINSLWLHHGDDLVPMRLAEESRDRSGWSHADLEALEFEQSAGSALVESTNIPTEAFLEKASRKIVEAAIKKTEAVRGTVAQRRLEKVDKPNEKASQQDRISGRVTPPHSGTSKGVPHAMADEDELEVVASILASAINSGGEGGDL